MNIQRIFPHLTHAVCAAHPTKGMQTASFCVCGRGSGGPAGSDACRDLNRLQEFFRWLKVDITHCANPDCQATILPNERYTNWMTKKTWEEEGKLCPECRHAGS